MKVCWEYEHIRDNFIDVCDRLEIGYEAAIDCEFDECNLDQPARDDLFFGIGYVRGLADAWDMTALQVVCEALAETKSPRQKEIQL